MRVSNRDRKGAARCTRFPTRSGSNMPADQSVTEAQRKALREALRKIELAAAAIDCAAMDWSVERNQQLMSIRAELRCAIDLLHQRLR